MLKQVSIWGAGQTVRSGYARIYSVFRTNSVAMDEILAWQTGVKVLPTHGIITPRSHYAFLER